MATPRTVSITLKHTDNSVWPSAAVTFELEMVTTDGVVTYPAYTYTLTTSGSGTATVDLMPGDYTLSLPSGEKLRITIPAGTGALELVTLIAGRQPAMSDDRWAAYKAAVQEYSRYRPRLVPDLAWDPFDDAVAQPVATDLLPGVPVGTIGIHFLAWGEQVSLEEIFTAAEGEQGWCFANDTLYMVPAPIADELVPVVWRAAHIPDETLQTCATIPARDVWLLELLTDANEAQAAQAAVESGLSSYTIGGTTVHWAQQGGAGSTGTTHAQKLRSEALAALREPMASLG